jgi:hypothetical protein
VSPLTINGATRCALAGTRFLLIQISSNDKLRALSLGGGLKTV